MDSIYLDLEASEDLFKLSDPAAFLNAHTDKLVILDEIQRAPDLFSVLRGLIDKNIVWTIKESLHERKSRL